jgi:uncharacterized protein YuzE
MSSLVQAFPSLTRELLQALRDEGLASLAKQVDQAVIHRVTFDEAANAAYIYVRPSRELNVVDTNIVGVRHGETIEVKTQYWTNLDTDNHGRLMGVEVLNPGELKKDLLRCANA